MSAFSLRILTADRPFYEGECESLVVPTADGYYGVLANHSNLIAAVIPGKLTFRLPDGKEEVAAISGGLLKVEEGRVLVLADSAERPEEIDEKRAERDAAQAKEALLKKMSVQEYHSTQAELARALNRLKVKHFHEPTWL